MTPTNEDLLALADRLDAPDHWISGSADGHEGENTAPYEAAAALRAIVAERQAIRDKALDDAAQAASSRAAYWWDASTAADDTGRKKLSLIFESKALACTENAAAIRAMKGKPE